MLAGLNRVDGIHQVGVVHHDFARLLRKLFADGINDVDEPGVRQILDVIHHRCTAGFYFVRQIADVGDFRTVDGQQIKQLLDLCQVFQLYLFDEQDVHFGHHVHGFQKILREVPVFKKERIEAVVDVFGEIRRGTCLG